MTVRSSIDPALLVEEHLAQASPDLLRELLQTFINALLSAEVDKVRAELAEYHQFARITDEIVEVNEAICRSPPHWTTSSATPTACVTTSSATEACSSAPASSRPAAEP